MTHDVTFVRPEVENHTPDWVKVDDVVKGERAVKEKRITYLPKPNPSDGSIENATRYDQYVDRAVFFNATGRTLEGLIGIAFKQGPEVEVPASMDFVESDIDGAGGGIENQSHRVLKDLLKNGRDGLLVDFPVTNQATSKAQQKAENIHATITTHKAESIINWRVDKAQNLVLVVIAETVDEPDGFGFDTVEQWRELSMSRLSTEDGRSRVRYIVRLWRKGEKDSLVIWEESAPKDNAGNFWSFIPFTFVGAVDNNPEIDKAPLLDLAVLNIAHYRNSADYEESAFFVGQPTFFMTGLDQAWIKDVWKDKGVMVGSRAVIPGPDGSDAKILEASPNTLAGAAMASKETQMVAVGARLLTHGEAVKTAEQSRTETAAAHSVLSLAATNMALAYTKALEWVALFTRGATGAVSYVMPVEYTEITADPNYLLAVMKAWQGGAIPESDKNAAYREIRLIHPDKTDEQIAAEIEAEGGGLELEE